MSAPVLNPNRVPLPPGPPVELARITVTSHGKAIRLRAHATLSFTLADGTRHDRPVAYDWRDQPLPPGKHTYVVYGVQDVVNSIAAFAENTALVVEG